MNNLKTDVLAHLALRHQGLLKFWTEGAHRPDASIEHHCDMVYSLFLLGQLEAINPSAVTSFCELAKGTRLPGWRTLEPLQRSISVHNCAYLFGALNLLGERFPGLYAHVLAGRKFELSDLADAQTLRPRFSSKWAHHNWRVSHWLGGVPSILLSLEAHAPEFLSQANLASRCRDAVDALMDSRTGLIRAYKSSSLQKLFRLAYGLRHSPDLGDMGGVAHILWIDHVLGRRYVAAEAIRKESSRLLLAKRPFMEKAPYCLDFDIVQALRTAIGQTTPASAAELDRAQSMMNSIEDFFRRPTNGYTLHKIPGALATYHECMLLFSATKQSTSAEAVDIIQKANWI